MDRMLDRFVDRAAHELKTPLTALRLQLQLNERLFRKHGAEVFVQSEYGDVFSQSLQQCDRLGRIIDEMLDVARVRAGKLAIEPRSHCLSDVLLEVSESHREELAKSGCDIFYRVESAVQANFDRDRIAKIYSCLLSNVARHAPWSTVEVMLYREESTIITRVRDYGPGIASSINHQVFAENSPEKSDLFGLGMSLHIARAIARAHGGDLTLNEEWKKGAEFVLVLPAALKVTSFRDSVCIPFSRLRS